MIDSEKRSVIEGWISFLATIVALVQMVAMTEILLIYVSNEKLPKQEESKHRIVKLKTTLQKLIYDDLDARDIVAVDEVDEDTV